MKLHLHDNKAITTGEKHGPRGPSHCADIEVDYPYQAEQWVIELEKDDPSIVRVECPDLACEWMRDDSGKFVKVDVPLVILIHE